MNVLNNTIYSVLAFPEVNIPLVHKDKFIKSLVGMK